MAKKSKKNKITETIVTQLQEPTTLTPPVEVKEEVKPKKEEEPKKKREHRHRVRPQESKLFDKPSTQNMDSETAGINFGMLGIL